MHEISFPESGLVLVCGPSGAGKSSIFLAIAYALKFSPFAYKDLCNWVNDDNCWVELSLTVDGFPLTLRRGKDTYLEFQGEKTTGVKQVDERLVSVLGATPNVLESLTYRRQRSPGLFLSKTDLQKREFLNEIIDLDWIQEEISVSNKKSADFAAELNSLEGEFRAKHQNVEELRKKAEFGIDFDLEKKKLAEEFAQCSSDLSQRQISLQQLENTKVENLQELASLSEIDKQIDSVRSSNVSTEVWERKKAAESAYTETQKLSDRFDVESAKHLSKSLDPTVQIGIIKDSIHALEQQKCGMCNRSWDGADSKLTEFRNQLVELEKQKKSRDAFIQRVDQEKRSFRQKLAEQRATVQALEKEIHDIEKESFNKIEHLQKIKNSVIESLESKKTKYLVGIQNVKNEIFALEAKIRENKMKQSWLETQEKRAVEHKAEIKSKENDLERLNVLRSKLESDVLIESETVRLLKGFWAQFFQDFLNSLEHEANKIMGSLPNIAHCTVQFNSSRETADGRVRNEINTVVNFGNHQWDLEAGSSGGMLTSIEIAVDMALAKLVSERSAVNFGWLILDESFNGHSTETKEACLETLQAYASDRLILVVDHASETNEAFSSRINVQFTLEGSKLRVL